MTCDWPMPDDAVLEHLLPGDWATLPDDVKTRAVSMASRTIERLTGGRVSNCPVTIRPQRCLHTVKSPDPYYYGPGIAAVNISGVWANVPCGCSAKCTVSLPPPVGRVDEVLVNGGTLDPSLWRLDDGNQLRYIGEDSCPFPMRQDLNGPADGPNTMSVTYLNAYEPDEDGSFAMAVMAWEFGQAMVDEGQCRLPVGVEMIVRQGITMTVTPGSFPDGKTGIREIDAYLGMWNPAGLVNPPQVWSPEVATYSVAGG